MCEKNLNKIVGNAYLSTYEELCTEDLEVLTPSHFQIDRRLTAVQDSKLQETCRLSRFQYLSFSDYSIGLNGPQNISASYNAGINGSVKIGSMVLLRDDNLPPLQ